MLSGRDGRTRHSVASRPRRCFDVPTATPPARQGQTSLHTVPLLRDGIDDPPAGCAIEVDSTTVGRLDEPAAGDAGRDWYLRPVDSTG